MQRTEVSMPGKVIFFGEHSVVYGYSAIAVPINILSSCTITTCSSDFSNLVFSDYNRSFKFKSINEIENIINHQFIQFYKILAKIQEDFSIKLKNITINLKSSLWRGAGLGSSASTAGALVKAILKHHNLTYSEKYINNLVYFSEKIVHGKPSGIDNTVILGRKPIEYQNGNIKVLKSKISFPILISFSGEQRQTINAINKVAGLFQNQPKLIHNHFREIEFCAKRGIESMISGNIEEIGRLFEKNHEILKNFHLSTNKIEKIREIAKNNEAYGSKLTGAGLGGSVIIVGSKDTLETISKILRKNGFDCILTSIYM